MFVFEKQISTLKGTDQTAHQTEANYYYYYCNIYNFVCVCICVYIYIYIYTYTYTYTHTQPHIRDVVFWVGFKEKESKNYIGDNDTAVKFRTAFSINTANYYEHNCQSWYCDHFKVY